MTAYYNEFDPGAAAWLRELIKVGLIADGIVDDRSILDVEPSDLRGFTQCHFFAGIGGWSYALRLAGWPDDRPVWTGSPPCQPFSAAGKGLGRDDARHLGPHFVSLVRAARPAVLFGEQVASAAVFGKSASGAGKAAARAPEWAWLDDLSDRLEAARYAVGASDIPAAGVGAPHIRQRTFFGAVRLADAECSERGSISFCGFREADGSESCWSATELAGSLHGGRLADADDAGSQGRFGMPECAGERAARAGSLESGLADASISGRGEERQIGGRFGAGDGAQGRAAGLDAGREFGRLDDPASARHDGSFGGAEGNSRDEARLRVSGAGCADGGLAEPDRGQCNRIADGEGRVCDWTQAGWQQSDGEPECGGASGGPNAPDSPWGVADWLYCRDGKWRPVESSVLGVADGIPVELVRSGAFVPASSPLSKRQPGADRQSPNARRVMRLRGYGNAIAPQVAAEFIRAFDEVTQ